MAQLNKLIAQRQLIKLRVQSLRTCFDTISQKEAIGENDLLELKSRLTRTNTSMIEFEDIHLKLVSSCEDCTPHLQELQAFDFLFYDTTAKVQTLISNSERCENKVTQPSLPDNQNANISIPTRNSFEIPPHLPNISLPSFSGEFCDWAEFHDAFVSLIHNNNQLPDIQKLYYLNSCLKGKAVLSLKSLKKTAENYPIAWNLLKKRYENKKLIVQNNIKSLFNLEQIQKDSHSSLQHFIDEIYQILESLKAYEQPTVDILLIYIITAKFSTATRNAWEQFKHKNEFPALEELLNFLEDRCQNMGLQEANKPNQGLFNTNITNPSKQEPKTMNSKYKPQGATRAYVSQYTLKCTICNSDSHNFYDCQSFLNLNVNDRISKAKALRLCLNCFKKGHQSWDCRMGGCKKCNRKHNTIIHIENKLQNVQSNNYSSSLTQSNNQPSTSKVSESADIDLDVSQNTIANHSLGANCSTQVLLSTAKILISDNHGELHLCRALLDPGSQSNFVTTEVCDRLGLRKTHSNFTVSGISQSLSHIKYKTDLAIMSQFNDFKANISCLVLDQITDNLPNRTFDLSTLNIPGNIRLADPECNKPHKIDVLLGAGIFWELLCVGKHNLGRNKPSLHKTLIGWVLGGDLAFNNHNSQQDKIITCFSSLPEVSLEKQIEKFWALEECQNTFNKLSPEEQFCEDNFKNTTTRNEFGRFVVKIPFNSKISELSNSREMALKRFISLERKLNKNQELKQDYTIFMKEYQSLGHMTHISDESLTGRPHYYLPHHAVTKETSITTKLRVVFDGSAKSNSGISLNETQFVGPVIQHDLFSILLRFRMHIFVITADIAKMYRQVLVHESQRNMQLVLWRDESNEPIRTYTLNTVTYGTASSSFLAIRCLKQLAIDHSQLYPRASNIIQTDFYVDDLLTGCNSEMEGIQLQEELSKILYSGGFELRKWSSNSKNILKHLNSSVCSKSNDYLIDNEDTKTLGILWNSNYDYLHYNTGNFKVQKHITKRTILSITAQIFDPLGLLAPITIVAKLIIQQLWQLKLSWDESLPLDISQKWLKLLDQLNILTSFRIPRCIKATNAVVLEMHGFCDASEIAYGACIYVKSIDTYGNSQVSLFCAKSRVAPLKNISLPRLELCGALLLSQLAKRVSQSTNINFNKIFLWSDSTITLSWIKSPPNKWKTFVANRVAEIQYLSDPEDWYHVSTHDNPADLISRGVEPNQLFRKTLWWNGPSWLVEHSTHFPPQKDILQNNALEVRSSIVLTARNNNFNLIERFSSLDKLQRITAYCLRYINNLKCDRKDRMLGTLSVVELDRAMISLIKITQEKSFSLEIRDLSLKKEISHKSILLSLHPFLDRYGILRVGGRIKQSNFNFDKKHPIILPKSHTLTDLIIQKEHIRLLHCGPNMLLASLRDQYWPISGRSVIRKTTRKCVTCFRAKPKTIYPIMGDLPHARITPSFPFHNCGVDYAGPVSIRNKVGRGSKIIKSYICIFVCLSTKAIHLELVGDLTTETFLAALRRFIGRRGQPLNIYSDNGSNFIGANSELADLHNFFINQATQRKIIDTLSVQKISWHFIPPRSPHFGGLWEAGVRSVKNHLKRVSRDAMLTFEQFYTLLVQIEAVLNSRPLSQISSGPNDFEPLSPAHFLIGRKLTSTPEPSLIHIKDNKLNKYQHIQKLTQHFWNRWNKEYICELQQRSKWKQNSTETIPIGALVLLKENNLPSLKWKLGRVTELHNGQDGVSRVVVVKCANGSVIKRAVTQICVLPLFD